jgi:hypothetical protein
MKCAGEWRLETERNLGEAKWPSVVLYVRISKRESLLLALIIGAGGASKVGLDAASCGHKRREGLLSTDNWCIDGSTTWLPGGSYYPRVGKKLHCNLMMMMMLWCYVLCVVLCPRFYDAKVESFGRRSLRAKNVRRCKDRQDAVESTAHAQ